MTTPDANPLLTRRFEIPFDAIDASHVEPAVDALIEQAKSALAVIGALQEPRTYENTIEALDRATEGLEYAMGVVGHLEAVATTPRLRAAYDAVQPEVAAFSARIPLDPVLWKAVREYAQTDEARALDPIRRRRLDKLIDDFRRHGAELDDAGKRRLEAIDVELAQVTTKFAHNVLDSTNAWELVITDEARLAGLPESARQMARQAAASKGVDGWRFTLAAPSYIALITHLDDPGIREAAYRAYNTRATEPEHDNRPLLRRILELRSERARLLGYRDFADLVLENRMAGSGARAMAFVEELRDKTRPAFEAENAALLAFRRTLEGADAPPLMPWDVAYYAEKQRKALYDFDEEELRPYFPLPKVIAGMFTIAQRLYGITIEPTDALPVWHEDVRAFRIVDGDGTFLGAFYVDPYPRETKRDGAWMHGLITGRSTDGGLEPHLGLICANVTPPADDRPALLTHREVETLFHEFGHLMHHCLSRVPVRSLGGTHVAWDFVELPSQIMENWCWEREALDMFARHWETDEPIPDTLFERMDRARTFRAANAMMRQLGFATVDLALHTRYDAARDGDVLDFARAILQDHAPAPLPPDYAMLTSFTHLFAHPVGYAAAYYSYKWAEVLDADAFSVFRARGIFDAAVGRAFRDTILARGDSEDPMELYRAFTSREPRVEPLLERAGLLQKAS